MKTFKAGFHKTDITPELGVRLAGYNTPERPAEVIHDNLFSSALVMESGELRVAIISLDWVCITAETASEIQTAVEKVAQIPADNIIVCAIHTHSAPNTMDVPGWGGVDQEYIDSVMPAIIESAKQAVENLAPARMGVSSVTSLTGVNRRTVLEDGTVCFERNTSGSFDPNMTFVSLVGLNDEPIVSLVHYGAHCTAWSITRDVSRDWAGVMINRLETQLACPAMFINGAIGDVGPRTNNRNDRGKYTAGGGDGLESVLEVGYRAATDALNCYESIDSFEGDIEVKTIISDIKIPAKPLPSLNEAKVNLAELESFKDGWGGSRCKYEYWMRVLNAHSRPLEDSIIYESRIIAFGPVAIMSLPGEPFSSISLRIREGSPFQYTLIASNANGCVAYIPDQEGRSIGGYEVAMESAVLTYLPVDNSDEFIVATGIEKLKQIAN